MTRRNFLLSGAALSAGAISGSPAADTGPTSRRLLTGWEHYRGSLGGIWEAWRGNKASDNVTWRPVELPHCFNARDAVDPDEPYYQGPGWYRSTVTLANPYPNGRTLLRFEGAGQTSTVWVYMEQVATHIGGYDEFIVDVTDAVAKLPAEYRDKGLLPIAVECDNSRDLERIPSSLSDFNLYGGLYRYVNLCYVPAIALDQVHAAAAVAPDGKARVSIRSSLYNPRELADELRIAIEVTDPRGQTIHTASATLPPWRDAREMAAFTIDSPGLWSPSSPLLYRCTLTLRSAHGEMRTEERFGARHFEFVEHGPFKLNGERLLLQGTSRHEDHAGLAAAMPEDLIRKEMVMIKEMGANFIRLAHYQQSRIVLGLCDELGILVWEEIPWCRGGLGGERYQRQARDMLRAMIGQHYNHPSVILWGLGNENDWPGDFPEFDQSSIRAFMTELNQLAHQLDPSRKTAIRRCDFCRDIPDVYSPSIWAGWYRGRYTEYKAESEKEMRRVGHFFHAEWGGDSHALRHSEDPDRGLTRIATGQGADERGLDYLLTGGQARASRDGDWSETYICNLFDWHLKEQQTMDWLTGAAQWIFKDFSTPLRPENPVPRMNQKGVVERDLTPKEGYFVFQSYWAAKPMAHIYGHTWPVRWGAAGESKLVKVYSNCPAAELFLNGASCGIKKRNSADFPAAGLRWVVQFQEGENHIRVIARKAGVEVADEIRLLYQTRKWSKPARLELKEVARKPGTITVQARLLDAAGVQCLDSRTLVRFGLSGGGRLLDNLGTTRGSRKVELYNGRAGIGVSLDGGPSVISAACAGVPPTFLPVS